MKTIHIKACASLLAVAGLLCSAPANAQLSFTIDPQMQASSPGDVLTFSGSLSNGQNRELFLDAISYNFAADPTGTLFYSPDASLDPFFNGTVPFSLLDTSDVYTGDIFALQVDPLTPPATYIGTATISSHYDGQADFDTSQNFQFTVNPASTAAVPESNTFVLFGIGMAALGCTVMRRRLRS
jgi:hypothetical protein